jgi:hypothetical protein
MLRRREFDLALARLKCPEDRQPLAEGLIIEMLFVDKLVLAAVPPLMVSTGTRWL